MKLFSFQPRGHGELSFFVMAESEIEARESVSKFIKMLKPEQGYARTWDTDNYEMTVSDANEVISNDNG